ncbi:MAG: hypothetical protein QOF67_60, partial [Mycobacterium sp.]|nr:hypothetical protein [Mycobacterium sp.]
MLPGGFVVTGHNPAHKARCAAVGNLAISTPISEMITWAARSPIPGIVANSSVCWRKGRAAS